MTTIAPRYPAPGVAQYSLGVQREIVPSLILMTQYVGNVGVASERDIPDQPVPAEHTDGRRVQLAGAGQTHKRANDIGPGRSLASTESARKRTLLPEPTTASRLDCVSRAGTV